jgi:SAM-dependent methyltransferase
VSGLRTGYENLDEYKARIWSGIRCWRLARAEATSLLLQRTTWYRLSGIELNPAHRGYILTRWGIEVFGDPIEQNKIPAESFDNIVSFNCLEHIPNPSEQLRGISRTVRLGGCVLIGTCNADALAACVVGKWLAMYRVPDHVSIPSKRGLESEERRS